MGASSKVTSFRIKYLEEEIEDDEEIPVGKPSEEAKSANCG